MTMMRARVAGLIVAALAAAAVAADNERLLPLPPGNNYRHQEVEGKILAKKQPWRLLAVWTAPPGLVQGASSKDFSVTGPENLIGVAIEFGEGDAKLETDRFLADAGGEHDPDGLRVRIDSRLAVQRVGGGSDLARQALRFFCQPEAKAPAKQWFRLLFDRRAEDQANRKRFLVNPHNQPVHQDRHYESGIIAFLGLMDEIGREGNGRVFWMVEPGDDNPGRVILGWQPHGVAWWAKGVTPRKCKLASPMWSKVFEVEAFEPPVEWVSLHEAGRAFGLAKPIRTGLIALPPKTWSILDRCSGTSELVALGREGVVLRTGDAYEIHILRKDAKGYVRYDSKPMLTRGLNESPAPEWTKQFNLKSNWSPDEARHLVALAVCSPDVWRRPRGPGVPAEHLRPLFMDPELWACPKAP